MGRRPPVLDGAHAGTVREVRPRTRGPPVKPVRALHLSHYPDPMQKIPTLFLRDPDNRARVLPEVNPECQWVLDGEGTPTRKWDGTCVLRDDEGSWWARREVKPGKTPPPDFQAVHNDPVTGRTVGWEPIEQSPFHAFHAEAMTGTERAGTYELCGPKINRNQDSFAGHVLMPHGWEPLSDRRLLDSAARVGAQVGLT